jgi:hypothetical protein
MLVEIASAFESTRRHDPDLSIGQISNRVSNVTVRVMSLASDLYDYLFVDRERMMKKSHAVEVALGAAFLCSPRIASVVTQATRVPPLISLLSYPGR